MPSASKTAPNRHIVHPYDKKYGTDTSGYLSPEDLVTGQTNDAQNYGYSAIAPSVFREAFRRWRETLPAVSGRVEAYSFVDAGAGKGRAMLLAAEQPFRKVLGVELNPELARVARRNVGISFRRLRAKIRVVQDDVLNLPWPRTPLLVYLYNPFHAAVVSQLADRLADAARAGSGLVDVLYMNPTCTDTLTAAGHFSHLWTVRIEMDEPDQKADPYGTTSDLVSAFRFTR